MAFTAITDREICVQEGTLIWNYTASGTILRGQAVEIVDYPYVIATDSNPANGFIGVADANATAGGVVGVWGYGNIVYGRVSGTSVTAGAPVVACVNGEFRPYALTDLPPSGAHGIALQTQATTDGVCLIFLY